MSVVKPKRLGELITFKRGYDLPEKSRVFGSFPVISSAGISGYHNEYKAEGEGVVTGRYGTLGQMYFVDGKYWPHNTALYVKDFKGNDPQYIYYLLSCIGHIRTSDKSAVPGVNRNELHEMAVPAIEDKDMQIAVRQLLKLLDNKIELNNKINAELEAMAKLIYDYWFVQFDFPDNNGKPYKSSGGKMVYNEELKREIPDGWTVGDVDSECSVRNGYAFKSESYTKSGYTIVRTKNFKNGSVDLGDMAYVSHNDAKSFKRYELAQFDFLLVMVGASVGKNVVVNSNILPALQNQNMWCFRSKHLVQHFSNQLLKRIVKEQLNTSSGSAREFFKKESFKEAKFANPTIQLKKLYCVKVESTFNRIDIIKNENQKLKELRDWLLPMLMNGQVTIGKTPTPVKKEAMNG
jgi:type I restriction enzyme S subunit